MADYIPAPDAEFNAWQGNFLTYARGSIVSSLSYPQARGEIVTKYRWIHLATCDELRCEHRL